MTVLNTDQEDNPRFTVEELLDEFDLTLDPAPSFPKIIGAILDERALLSNPHFTWLVDQGLLARNSKPSNGWHKMICPLVHEHTDGDESGTGIRFATDGKIAFHCFHSHGDKFRTKEYLEWARQQNGPTALLTAAFTWDEPDLLLLEPERGPLPEPPPRDSASEMAGMGQDDDRRRRRTRCLRPTRVAGRHGRRVGRRHRNPDRHKLARTRCTLADDGGRPVSREKPCPHGVAQID
jgi:hypothetical protein